MITETELRDRTIKAAQSCLEPNPDKGIELLRWTRLITLYCVLDPDPKDIKGTPIEELLFKRRTHPNDQVKSNG